MNKQWIISDHTTHPGYGKEWSKNLMPLVKIQSVCLLSVIINYLQTIWSQFTSFFTMGIKITNVYLSGQYK